MTTVNENDFSPCPVINIRFPHHAITPPKMISAPDIAFISPRRLQKQRPPLPFPRSLKEPPHLLFFLIKPLPIGFLKKGFFILGQACWPSSRRPIFSSLSPARLSASLMDVASCFALILLPRGCSRSQRNPSVAISTDSQIMRE